MQNEKQKRIEQIQKKKKINKHKKKHEEQIIYKNLNPFKQQQKFYKLYQDKQTDFSQLFNLETAQKFEVLDMIVYKLPAPEDGAYYVKGFNSIQIVNEIGFLALNEFWKKPYRTNLNSRNQLYEQKENQKQTKQQKQQQQNNKKYQISHLQEFTQEEFLTQLKQKGYCFNDKIRWANVGHQYDWTLRKYPEYHTPMHPKIKQLTDRANKLYNELVGEKKQYHPESAIVNYYGQKDYMTGHLDDAEYDQESPIYSFSFGLSCIFLMGGRTKDEKPLAIRLDSGDLLIMSKNSRKCYHGVPRVIALSYISNKNIGKAGQQNQNNDTMNSPKNVENYYSTHRMNINIRQVFPQNQ